VGTPAWGTSVFGFKVSGAKALESEVVVRKARATGVAEVTSDRAVKVRINSVPKTVAAGNFALSLTASDPPNRYSNKLLSPSLSESAEGFWILTLTVREVLELPEVYVTVYVPSVLDMAAKSETTWFDAFRITVVTPEDGLTPESV
jgi:hypothetical protein